MEEDIFTADADFAAECDTACIVVMDEQPLIDRAECTVNAAGQRQIGPVRQEDCRDEAAAENGQGGKVQRKGKQLNRFALLQIKPKRAGRIIAIVLNIRMTAEQQHKIRTGDDHLARFVPRTCRSCEMP